LDNVSPLTLHDLAKRSLKGRGKDEGREDEATHSDN